MKPEYLPTTPDGRMWRLVEECSEVIYEACKCGRFGMQGHVDFIASGQTNRARLVKELADLKHAIAAVEADLDQQSEAELENS